MRPYLIAEAIFIGFYCVFIYKLIEILLSFPINIYLELFIIGFLKHFIGYLIGIQSLYCNMLKDTNDLNKYEIKSNYIIYECIMEGLAFIYFGYLLKFIKIDNKLIYYFLLGFILHIFSDYFGIHKLLFIYNCVKKN